VPSKTRTPRPKSRGRRSYHHGDLRRALLEQALSTIGEEGVAALTLRGVGQSLGVSRSALYRHFADKSALLEAVATDGFRRFRTDLQTAWEGAGRGLPGLADMGVAYVRFAVANPSHFRVMFSGALRDGPPDPERRREGDAAFHVLLDAIVELQADGQLRRDDPQLMARYIWAVVHGIAMLSLDVPAHDPPIEPDTLARYGVERMMTGLTVRAGRFSDTASAPRNQTAPTARAHHR